MDPRIIALFRPQNIAVVGVSRKPGKIGRIVFENIVLSGFKGKVYPVNPLAKEIMGYKVYPSLESLPGPVDLVVVAVPAPLVPDVMRQACAKEAKAAIVITAGFSEVGNTELEEKVVNIARSCGIRILGPNVFGVIYTPENLNATFGPRDVPRGNIAILTQSGALGLALLYWFTRQPGLGVSAMVSLGNMVDVDFSDLLEFFGEDEYTKIIAVYMEGLHGDGRKFVEIASKVSKKKPILVLKAGKYVHGAKAVASHTGSLAGSYEAYKAAFRRAGIVDVDNLPDLLDALKLFSMQPINEKIKRGLMILTNGGGLGVMAADAADYLGVNLVQLESSTKERISKLLPWFASKSNPLDTTASITTEKYIEVLHTLIDDDKIPAILAIYAEVPNMPIDPLDKAASEIAKHAREQDKLLAFVMLGGEKAMRVAAKFERNSVPVYVSPYDAMKAIRRMLDYVEYVF